MQNNNGQSEWKPILPDNVQNELKLLDGMRVLEKTLEKMSDIAGERMCFVGSIYIIDPATNLPIEPMSKYFAIGTAAQCVSASENLYNCILEDAENALSDDSEKPQEPQ